MACILYKDGETLRCNPEDMDREIAAGWSTKNPDREEVENEETTSEETTTEEPNEETNEEPQKKRKKILGIL
jgi:hypothetical protein